MKRERVRSGAAALGLVMAAGAAAGCADPAPLRKPKIIYRAGQSPFDLVPPGPLTDGRTLLVQEATEGEPELPPIRVSRGRLVMSGTCRGTGHVRIRLTEAGVGLVIPCYRPGPTAEFVEADVEETTTVPRVTAPSGVVWTLRIEQ